MIKPNSPQSRKGRREENFSLAVERQAREKYISPLGSLTYHGHK